MGSASDAKTWRVLMKPPKLSLYVRIYSLIESQPENRPQRNSVMRPSPRSDAGIMRTASGTERNSISYRPMFCNVSRVNLDAKAWTDWDFHFAIRDSERRCFAFKLDVGFQPFEFMVRHRVGQGGDKVHHVNKAK